MILISCGEVRREVSNYIGDEVTPEVRARIDEHVRFCPGCKAVYDGVRNVLTLLGSGDIIELPRGFSLRLFERLRAVGDERAFPSPRNMSQNLRAKLDQFVHSEEAGQAEGAHQIPLGITLDSVALGSHLIYFLETDEEFERGVRFLYPGLGRGEHCIVFGHDEAIEKVKNVLRARGFDPDDLVQQLQLTVLRRQSSADGTLSDIADIVRAAVGAGATAVRFLGNLGMGQVALPAGEDDVVDLECRVSSAIQGLPCVIVCMYDVRTLSGRLILNGGLKTHRLAVGREGVRENPYYQPGPDLKTGASSVQ